jgi:hypothetical protein
MIKDFGGYMIKLICSDCNGVLDHLEHDYSKSGYCITKENDPEILIQSIKIFDEWFNNNK